jgi:hypothetical protein
VNKNLEVEKLQFVCDSDGGGEGDDGPSAPRIALAVSVNETDPSIYEWELSEELTPYDVAAAPGSAPYTVPPPTGVSITLDSSTVIMLANGGSIQRALVNWTPPADPYVNVGGTIQVQYQLLNLSNSRGIGQPEMLSSFSGGGHIYFPTAWVDAGSLSGTSTYTYVQVPAGYNAIRVQVRALRSNGAASVWVQDTAAESGTPVTITNPHPILLLGSVGSPVIQFADGASLSSLEPMESAANNTLNHILMSTAQLGAAQSYAETSAPYPVTALTGLSFAVNINASADVLNYAGALVIECGAAGAQTAELLLCVDGNTAAPAATVPLQLWMPAGSTGAFVTLPVGAGITGLAAGAHTIDAYISTASGAACTVESGNLIQQHIF